MKYYDRNEMRLKTRAELKILRVWETKGKRFKSLIFSFWEEKGPLSLSLLVMQKVITREIGTWRERIATTEKVQSFWEVDQVYFPCEPFYPSILLKVKWQDRAKRVIRWKRFNSSRLWYITRSRELSGGIIGLNYKLQWCWTFVS